MSIPVENFPSLVTDYDVDWDRPGACGHDECEEQAKSFLKDGEYYEHGFVHFDNGYTASLLRLRRGEFISRGFEDGLWEMSVGVEADPITKMVMGVEYTAPKEDLNLPGFEDGIRGNLDNAKINELLALVSRLPMATSQDDGGGELLRILRSLGVDETETEQEEDE